MHPSHISWFINASASALFFKPDPHEFFITVTLSFVKFLQQSHFCIVTLGKTNVHDSLRYSFEIQHEQFENLRKSSKSKSHWMGFTCKYSDTTVMNASSSVIEISKFEFNTIAVPAVDAKTFKIKCSECTEEFLMHENHATACQVHASAGEYQENDCTYYACCGKAWYRDEIKPPEGCVKKSHTANQLNTSSWNLQ